MDSTVVVPVQGSETTQDIEVNDADLDHRTRNNKSDISTLFSQNSQLRGELTRLETNVRSATSGQFNSVLTQNANLRAELSELESRLNIVQKDYERLLRVSQNQTVQ